MSDKKDSKPPAIDVNTLSLASCHNRTYEYASKLMQLAAVDHALKSHDVFTDQFGVACTEGDLGAILELTQRLNALDTALAALRPAALRLAAALFAARLLAALRLAARLSAAALFAARRPAATLFAARLSAAALFAALRPAARLFAARLFAATLFAALRLAATLLAAGLAARC